MMHMQVLGNCKNGLVFICSAPAGTGKTTLVDMLVAEFPLNVVRSVSYTTRLPRPGEISGVHYHFVTEEEFEDKVSEDEFIEYVNLYGFYYGTSRKAIHAQQALGKHVILVIDTQGALQLKGKFPAVFVFIKPPSFETLSARLYGRKTETQHMVEQRLAWAQKEIEAARYYDYCVVNDDLNTAYQVLRSILIAEEHKILVHHVN